MPNGPRSRLAGAYAEERYRRGLRNYRRTARPVLAGIFGPLIFAGVAFGLIDGHIWSWLAGLATGAFGAAWAIVRDEPPAYVEHWREGAEGERKTAKALEPLERSGLHVVHDVQQRYGNYDHIAVGRAGVFLLETKNPKGIVELRGGVPHVRRRFDPEADIREERIRQRALSAAVRLNKDIEQRTGSRAWVQAVVVFWSEFPEGLVDDGRCVFIHGPRLAAWMQSLPNRLGQNTAERIAATLLEMENRDSPSMPPNLAARATPSTPTSED